MSEIPLAAQTLSKFSVSYRLFHHKEPVTSIEQAANERGQNPDQIVRSILFRISERNFVMVLIAGSSQISWQKLRVYLGQSRLTLATDDEVFEITGYHVGAVSPLGISNSLRILADENVFVPAEISIGSGQRDIAIILKSADLRCTLDNIEISKFA